jgi:hypothetical protein
MGDILDVECACGYSERGLTVGCGMRHTHERRLTHCRTCRVVVSVRGDAKRPRCPHCRGQVTAIAAEIDPRERGPLSCPRCGERTLMILETGVWD